MSCKEDALKQIDRLLNLTVTQKIINNECIEIADLLIKKNRAYGNSFAQPINIFCKLSAEDQLNCRIDDKLNRIKNGTEKDQVPEDTELDLIGYLILRRVQRKISTGVTAQEKEGLKETLKTWNSNNIPD